MPEQHTKKPWVVSTIEGAYYIKDASGVFIAKFFDERKAQDLVKAVNSHDTLKVAVTTGLNHINIFPQDDIGQVVIRIMKQLLKEATEP